MSNYSEHNTQPPLQDISDTFDRKSEVRWNPEEVNMLAKELLLDRRAEENSSHRTSCWTVLPKCANVIVDLLKSIINV